MATRFGDAEDDAATQFGDATPIHDDDEVPARDGTSEAPAHDGASTPAENVASAENVAREEVENPGEKEAPPSPVTPPELLVAAQAAREEKAAKEWAAKEVAAKEAAKEVAANEAQVEVVEVDDDTAARAKKKKGWKPQPDASKEVRTICCYFALLAVCTCMAACMIFQDMCWF